MARVLGEMVVAVGTEGVVVEMLVGVKLDTVSDMVVQAMTEIMVKIVVVRAVVVVVASDRCGTDNSRNRSGFVAGMMILVTTVVIVWWKGKGL